ncbi:hypothetical protein SAMN05216466_106100 [Paraburkholderia phenazinium]|uniref:Uncharacterized protein n=1 Tax=Paraburkholderia phenazinium TaxID=60549 RepID=A0A1G7YA82_9BURK|nr:ankyrin repeat domain-containing protein [Paraburkholderia phenazinium]SDG93263.1 hypothetical protein SAMN05216466_106100 [Paraburkholderia phenazinium]
MNQAYQTYLANLRTSPGYLRHPPGSDGRLEWLREARKQRRIELSEAEDWSWIAIEPPGFRPWCPSCEGPVSFDERQDTWTCTPCETAYGEAVLAGARDLPFCGTKTFTENERITMYEAFRDLESKRDRIAEAQQAEQQWAGWCDRLDRFVPPAPMVKHGQHAVVVSPDERATLTTLVALLDSGWDGDGLFAHFLRWTTSLVVPGQEAFLDAMLSAAVSRDVDLHDSCENPVWWSIFRNLPGGDPRERFRPTGQYSRDDLPPVKGLLDIDHAWRVLDILDYHAPHCFTVNSLAALSDPANEEAGDFNQGRAIAHRALLTRYIEHRFNTRINDVLAYGRRRPNRRWRARQRLSGMLHDVWRSRRHLERVVEAGTDVGVDVQNGLLDSGPILCSIIASKRHSDEETARIVTYLVAHGAPINALTGTQETALHEAANAGYIVTAQVLIDAGIDVRHKDHLRWTAGHTALLCSHFELFELIVQAGLDPEPIVDKFAMPGAVMNDQAGKIRAYCHAYQLRLVQARLREVADAAMADAPPVQPRARRRL